MGAALAVAGLTIIFLLMAHEGQVPRGPLWGGLALLAAAFGLCVAFGWMLAGDGDAPAADGGAVGPHTTEPRWAAPLPWVLASALIAIVGGMLGGGAALPYVIPVALAALIPPALRRPGLLVFVIVSAVYLPMLGAYGLWDPWETHYGEVAREILARNDWISLWWAQEDWFWSKPILIFWAEALSMGAFDVDFRPDANPAHPEWAIRLPIFAISMGAVLASYAATARIVSRRAGVVVALVMATMPHFFFLSHQAITDMAFVGNMTIAMALLALAVTEDPEREVRRRRIGPFAVSWQHAAIVALIMVALPQALYLITRNVTLYLPSDALAAPDPGFAWHADAFASGSADNDHVVGNPTARTGLKPYLDAAWAQPAAQGALWLVGMVGLVWMLSRQRRAQALLMFGFYLFCALAFMGKGIPGFALPGMVALLYLVASGRWSLLLQGRLRILSGALTIAVVGLPWYVAMFARHGPPFTERLLVHDHLKRLGAGVHGDQGSIGYFLMQLGYATFPWVGLIPFAVVGWLWLRRATSATPSPMEVPQPSVGAMRATADPRWGGGDDADGRRQLCLLMGMWFFAAFTLFSAMMTKFHHYIFPAVPPAAVLVGLVVDRAMGAREQRTRKVWPVATLLAVAAPLPLVLGLAGLTGDVRGVMPVDAGEDWVLRNPWPAPLAWALVAAGLLLLGGAVWLWRRRAAADGEPKAGEHAAMATVLAGAAVLTGFVGRDLAWETAARPQGYERFIQLFIYKYDRPWPDYLDYRPILTAFAVIAAALLALAALRRLRPIASRALLGLALLTTAWTLNVYMIDLSPHWGQRELFKAYYEERTGPEGPIAAFQMNWKGENFYTCNRVHAFVKLDNKKLKTWVQEHKGNTAYFVLEHKRLNSFRSVLRGKKVEEVTDLRLNNKFLLVRAQL
jgi:4-amino-4-deoxy-L-arabinose transferase-like glycosyltransferase